MNEKERPTKLRWLILILSCLSLTGGYYAYDLPAALYQQLEDYAADKTEDYSLSFNLLYSLYSVPNTILPFFGGVIVDRIGAASSATLFSSVFFVGQIIFSLGIQSKSWNVMWLGRIICGLGGESCGVATSALLTVWFERKELALAFGLTMAVSRMGSVLNNLISPVVANAMSVPYAVWLGTLINGISFLFVFLIYYISLSHNKEEVIGNDDRYDETEINGSNHQKEMNVGEQEQSDDLLTTPLLEQNYSVNGEVASNTQSLQLHPSPLEVIEPTSVVNYVGDSPEFSIHSDEKEDAETYKCVTLCNFGLIFWLLCGINLLSYGCVLPFNNVAVGILLERNYFTDPPSDCALQYPAECAFGTIAPSGGNTPLDANGNACNINDNNYPILPTSINITNYSNPSSSWNKHSYIFDILTQKDIQCSDPFWSEACTANYCSVEKKATKLAARVMSIPYFIAAITSPLFGYIIDRFGNLRTVLITLSTMITLSVHLTLALSKSISPIIPLIGLGITFSCFAALLWPSMPLSVGNESTGLAFGVATAGMNSALALFPIIVAWIHKHDNGQRYIPNVEFFFAACAGIATVLALVLHRVDRNAGGVLNRTVIDQDEELPGYDEKEVGIEDDEEYVTPFLSETDYNIPNT